MTSWFVALAFVGPLVAGCGHDADACVEAELRYQRCADRAEPTAAGLQFLRDSCASRRYQRAHAGLLECVREPDCDAFLRCQQRVEGGPRGLPFH